MRVLVREELFAELEKTPPLVEGLLDPLVQVQPHGIDLSIAEIRRLSTQGRIGFSSDVTLLPEGEVVPFALSSQDVGLPENEGTRWAFLTPGPYRIRLAERVHLPIHIFAIARPRSSLLRMGVHVGTALWDAGYSGRGEALFVVHNPGGVYVAHRARVLQLVFFRLDTPPGAGYMGTYQGEG